MFSELSSRSESRFQSRSLLRRGTSPSSPGPASLPTSTSRIFYDTWLWSIARAPGAGHTSVLGEEVVDIATRLLSAREADTRQSTAAGPTRRMSFMESEIRSTRL